MASIVQAKHKDGRTGYFTCLEWALLRCETENWAYISDNCSPGANHCEGETELTDEQLKQLGLIRVVGWDDNSPQTKEEYEAALSAFNNVKGIEFKSVNNADYTMCDVDLTPYVDTLEAYVWKDHKGMDAQCDNIAKWGDSNEPYRQLSYIDVSDNNWDTAKVDAVLTQFATDAQVHSIGVSKPTPRVLRIGGSNAKPSENETLFAELVNLGWRIEYDDNILTPQAAYDLDDIKVIGWNNYPALTKEEIQRGIDLVGGDVLGFVFTNTGNAPTKFKYPLDTQYVVCNDVGNSVVDLAAGINGRADLRLLDLSNNKLDKKEVEQILHFIQGYVKWLSVKAPVKRLVLSGNNAAVDYVNADLQTLRDNGWEVLVNVIGAPAGGACCDLQQGRNLIYSNGLPSIQDVNKKAACIVDKDESVLALGFIESSIPDLSQLDLSKFSLLHRYMDIQSSPLLTPIPKEFATLKSLRVFIVTKAVAGTEDFDAYLQRIMDNQDSGKMGTVGQGKYIYIMGENVSPPTPAKKAAIEAAPYNYKVIHS